MPLPGWRGRCPPGRAMPEPGRDGFRALMPEAGRRDCGLLPAEPIPWGLRDAPGRREAPARLPGRVAPPGRRAEARGRAEGEALDLPPPARGRAEGFALAEGAAFFW